MSIQAHRLGAWLCQALLVTGSAWAGPYSAGFSDPANTFDAPVPGFVGTGGEGVVGSGNALNPLFFGWAAQVTQYTPTAGVAAAWTDITKTLGPVSGDNFDIASLGDLSATQLTDGNLPGKITLSFLHPILNFSGADFVVFENAFGSTSSVFGELAYVEVSSDGNHYARFPSRSLTASAVGAFSNINPSDVFNLAGKHVNASGKCWGTPFDLSQLATDSLVTGGQVNLNDIRYVRLVDIPGNGSFSDSLGNPIYDASVTVGSGGFDLEAIGVISRRVTYNEWAVLQTLPAGQDGPDDDADGDGLSNLHEYAHGRQAGRAENQATPLTLGLEAESADPGAPVRMALTFIREERASDLIYEVQASNGNLQGWTTLARSTGGQPFIGVNGYAPEIGETAAAGPASVGVLRRVKLVDVERVGQRQARFLRLKISTTP